MSEKKVDIEEIIADARAEEEVARKMAKIEEDNVRVWGNDVRNDFRDELRGKLKEAFTPKEEESVRIELREYVTLVNKAMDLDRVLNAIVDNLKLSYNNEYLRLDDETKVVDAFRVLYPEAYDALYAAELDRLERQEALLNSAKKKEA